MNRRNNVIIALDKANMNALKRVSHAISYKVSSDRSAFRTCRLFYT